jgi:hypothetical protein
VALSAIFLLYFGAVPTVWYLFLLYCHWSTYRMPGEKKQILHSAMSENEFKNNGINIFFFFFFIDHKDQ